MAGGFVSAASTMLQRHRDGYAVLTLSYKGAPLFFRGVDSNAIEEVLSDEEYGFLKSYLESKPAPRIVDVGCHIGTFAMWALAVNPAATVLSVEADRETYEVALMNLKGRSAGSGHWSLVNKAASARDDEVLRFSTEGPSMSHRVSDEGSNKVSSISLGSLLRPLASTGAPIDLMKVDIEGSEEAFLCEDPGLLAIVERLVVELHPGRCDTDRVRRDLAGQFDSITEVAGRRSSKPLLHCRRTT